MKTEYVAELSDGLLDAARDAFAECPIPEGQVGFLHLGGALNEHDWDDGVVGNRDARFACGVLGMWERGEPNADAFRQWIRDGWARVRPVLDGPHLHQLPGCRRGRGLIRAAYGVNYDRLVEVKQEVRPG